MMELKNKVEYELSEENRAAIMMTLKECLYNASDTSYPSAYDEEDDDDLYDIF